jgi:gliding motility-associated-like protein
MKSVLLAFGLLFGIHATTLAQLNLDVPVITAEQAIICNGQSAKLTANSILGLTSFNWYASLLASEPIATGTIFTTPPLFVSTTYYVTSVNAASAESIRTLTAIVVLPALDLPLATALKTVLCSGESTTLTVLNTDDNLTYQWYSSLTDTSDLATGTSYQTNNLFNTTIFYLASVNQDNCQSARTPVIVTVLTTLSVPLATAENPIVCNNQKTSLEVQNANNTLNYYWYDDININTPIDSGIVFETPILTETAIFYVNSKNDNDCYSLKTPVAITVIPALDIPLVSVDPLALCSGQKATLTASSLLNNNTFNWYANLTDVTPFHTGPTYTTPALVTSTTYFVTSSDNNGCESIKTPVLVFVSPSVDVVIPLPNDPVICSGKSTDITATSVLSNTKFYWFSSLTDTTILDSGAVFATPVLYETSTFWVASADENGCQSLRAPALVTILPNTETPDAIIFPSVYCAFDTIRLTGFGADDLGSFNWYTSETDTVALNSDNPFYYALTDDSVTLFIATQNVLGCESRRTAVTLVPKTPVFLTAPELSCNGESITWNPVPNASNYEFSTNGEVWTKHNSTALNGYTGQQIAVRATSKQICVEQTGPTAITTCAKTTSVISNTITPNDDGINDFWILPQAIVNQSNEINIVTETGKLVYQTKNYNNLNNLFGGSDIKAGTYFYQILLPNTGEQQTGYLTVLKP